MPLPDCRVGAWDSTVYGHHRLVVAVADTTRVVAADLPWRRHGTEPCEVGLIVQSARTGRYVHNVVPLRLSHDQGRIAFEPVDGPGEYYVYYLPPAASKGQGAPGGYLPPSETADPQWVKAFDPQRAEPALPPADLVRYEASSALDSFAPMGFAATQYELAAIVDSHPGVGFLLFPEDRARPVGRPDYLPACWATGGAFRPYTGVADRGEFYVFQVGVYAVRELADLRVTVDGLPFPVRLITMDGVDAFGCAYRRRVDVAAGTTQSVWLGIDVSKEAEPAEHLATVTVSATGVPSQSVPVTLRVSDRVVQAHGTGDAHRLARLRWLGSTIAQDDEVVEPYVPVRVYGRRLAILGRTVDLGANGLPAGVVSHFDSAVTEVGFGEKPVLAGPVELDTGTPWEFGAFEVRQPGPSRTRWLAEGATVVGDGRLRLHVEGQLEADGCLDYRLTLRAVDAVDLDQVMLRVAVPEHTARYARGLGRPGGRCPASLRWVWNAANRDDDTFWLGDVNAGLQAVLTSWAHAEGSGVTMTSHAGARHLKVCARPGRLTAGETLNLDVRFLLTPFHPLAPSRHLRTRVLDAYAEPGTIAEYGGNVVHLGHGTPVNRYRNDPLLTGKALREYVRKAHGHGLRVALRYTHDEITRSAPEIPVLAGLGDEILAAGPGGGHPWLREHLGRGYLPVLARGERTEREDVAVVTTRDSPWHNVYVHRLDRLARRCEVDGISLSGTALDRTTMKRIRKVLARNRTLPFVATPPLVEQLPYADLIVHDHAVNGDSPDPAYWLVELSGIPFGLLAQGNHELNPWKAMTFGMTATAPKVDLRPLWKAWDELGLADGTMTGWWAARRLVRTQRADVLATVWHGEACPTVAVANWALEPVRTRLRINWKGLGLAEPDPASREAVYLVAPPIEGFQPAAKFGIAGPIPIAPGKGWLLSLRPLPRRLR